MNVSPENDNFCECVYTKVSELQRRSYASFGRDVDKIKEESIALAKDIIEKEKDANSREELLAGLDRFHGLYTTEYQDAIVLNGITGYWKHVVETNQDLFSDRKVSPQKILLSTVPNKLLNGVTMRDQEGAYAIVFCEGMRFIPMIFAETSISVLASTFAELDDGYAWDLHEAARRSNVEKQLEPIQRFIQDLLTYLTTPYIPYRDALPNIGNEVLNEASMLFWDGFLFFLNAHEFSHCRNDHGNSARRPIRNSDYIQTLHALFKENGIDAGDFDATKRRHFECDQFVESIADCEALLVIFEYSKRLTTFERKFLIMGALSFFWYLEFHERGARTLKSGVGWTSDMRYKYPNLVQNAIYRQSHPTPLSRFSEAGSIYTSSTIQMPSGFEAFWGLSDDIWKVLSSLYENIWSLALPIFRFKYEQSSS